MLQVRQVENKLMRGATRARLDGHDGTAEALQQILQVMKEKTGSAENTGRNPPVLDPVPSTKTQVDGTSHRLLRVTAANEKRLRETEMMLEQGLERLKNMRTQSDSARAVQDSARTRLSFERADLDELESLRAENARLRKAVADLVLRAGATVDSAESETPQHQGA